MCKCPVCFEEQPGVTGVMNHMAKEHQLYFTNLDEMNRRLVAIGLDEVKESEDKK